MTLPADIANRALDKAGVEGQIGDIEEGGRLGEAVLRHYAPLLKQLHRAVHWDFARQQSPMLLLADATGGTPNVGTLVPAPWVYEYAYPIDCMKARFVPWNGAPIQQGTPQGNIAIPMNVPMTGASLATPAYTTGLRPARFLVTTDVNYPVNAGMPTPDNNIALYEQQGISPSARTVILTNVPNASLVYTKLQVYPSLWDSQFEEAFVCALAAELAMPLAKDKKFGMQLRDDNIKIAIEKLKQARITDGNEGWFTNDIIPDWIRVRSSGSRGNGWYGAGGGPGYLFGGYSDYVAPNGSAY